jgi:transposase InsO family protein
MWQRKRWCKDKCEAKAPPATTAESVNGKFRNECLSLHWLRAIEEARYKINLWRNHYNNERLHMINWSEG